MNKTSLTVAVSLTLFLASCNPSDESTDSVEVLPVATEQIVTDTLNKQNAPLVSSLEQLYLDYQKEFLDLNPVVAIFRGNMDYNDQFPDHQSDVYLLKSKTLNEKYLKRLTAINPSSLTGSDRVSYDIFKYSREQALESYANGSTHFKAMLPVNQIFSLPQFLPRFASGQLPQPFNTIKDYENWVKRAKGFDGYVDRAISRMQEGVAKGVVMPTILMEKTIPQLEAQIVENIEDSPFYIPITIMPDTFSDEEKAKIKNDYNILIKDHLIASYKKLADYIKNDYMKHTRETHGIGSLPNGNVVYRQDIRQMTTTDMDVNEIHEMGLKQAKLLFNEMKKVKAKVGFEGNMQAFFLYLKTDPQFYYEDAESLIQGYEDLRGIINPTLDKIFNIHPETDYIIKAIEPFRERSMAAAQYFPGAPDGSRPGIFYVNTYDLKSRPKWMMETISIHEASPGHHFQISLNQEAGDLPPFRRFGGYSSYSEGWGLYSETLGLEMGHYKDPYQYLGMLYAQIWRANRLVVDTGIHAKGWTREQAIEFMKSNSPVSDTDAVVEVERYMAAPGQALSYMIGSIKIKELRKRAEEKLGNKFNLKKFHKEILADGAMPLAILEQKINRWIETQLIL